MFKKVLFICLMAMTSLPGRADAEKLFTVCINRECGYVDERGQWAIKPQFFAANPFDEEGLAWVQKDDRIGRINTKGDWVMEPILAYVGEYKDGLAWAELGESPYSYGFLNSKGQWAIEPTLSHAEDGMALPDDFKDGLARAGKGGKVGYINTKGEWAVPPNFHWIKDFSPNGLAVAAVDYDNFGYINKKGEWVIEPVFAHPWLADFNQQGLARVKSMDNLFGVINTAGEWVLQPIYRELGEYVAPNGLISAEIDDFWYYINMRGEKVIELFSTLPPKEFNESGQAWARSRGSWGYIDEEEGWLVKPGLDSVHDFSYGLAVVELNDKYGLIDMRGHWVLKPTFKNLGDFSGKFTSNLIPASMDGEKYGYINPQGEWVIPPTFFHTRNFVDGLAIASNGHAYGVINTQGQWVIQPMFYELEPHGYEPNGLMRMLYDEPEGDGLWVERVDKTGASRLLIGYDQTTEQWLHWEYEGDTRYLCDETGKKLLSIKFTCGLESVRNTRGEIIWPEKNGAEIMAAAKSACLAQGVRGAF